MDYRTPSDHFFEMVLFSVFSLFVLLTLWCVNQFRIHSSGEKKIKRRNRLIPIVGIGGVVIGGVLVWLVK